MKYALHVGEYRQQGPSKGLTRNWYPRASMISSQAGIPIIACQRNLISLTRLLDLAYQTLRERRQRIQ